MSAIAYFSMLFSWRRKRKYATLNNFRRRRSTLGIFSPAKFELVVL